MLAEKRAQTLREIDERICELRAEGPSGLGPITYWHIARLESERHWLLEHSPGVEEFYQAMESARPSLAGQDR